MSEERDEIDSVTAEQVAQDSTVDDASLEKPDYVPDGQQLDPPLVTATLMPNDPTTIVQNAEAVISDSTVMTQAHILFDGDGETVSTSSYVESTSNSVPGSPIGLNTAGPSLLCRQGTSMESYTTAEEVLSQRSLLPTTQHEVVQIDAIEDSERSSSYTVSDDKKEKDGIDRMQLYCRIYLSIALALFIAGSIGMIFVGLHFGKLVADVPQMVPAFPTPVPTTMSVPTVAPVAGPPTTARPTLSVSPSQMPSCSGNYAQVASLQVAQSGSNHFTMSDDGDTIVVGNHHYQLSSSFLETFSVVTRSNGLTEAMRSASSEDFSIQDMLLSGDGSRLVLGLNSFLPSSENEQNGTSNEGGGALLQLDKIELNDDSGAVEWRTRHTMLTEGGFRSAVVNVATSTDGATVAFVADGRDDTGFYIEVHRENNVTNKLELLGQRLTQTAFDANTVVELSGNGLRLFIVTNDNEVRVFELEIDEDDGDWIQLGETIIYEGIAPQIHSSYNGTVVALGSEFQFPVAVFEERHVFNDATGVSSYDWNEVGKLDITTAAESQHFAVSGDGRNVVVGEKLANSQAVARLFRRSGSVFAKVQDMMLPSGNFRGMTLNMGGEQLVAAVEETVATYQKDCSGK